FNMWIDPAKASKWLAPAGSFREVLQSDVRPGGEVIFHTTNGSISGSSLKLAYQAIDSPCRLVYTRHACNAQGEPARDPHHPAWPETLLATVLFTDEGPGATRVTLAMEPAGDAADEEIEAFVQTRHSLTKEWTDCF